MDNTYTPVIINSADLARFKKNGMLYDITAWAVCIPGTNIVNYYDVCKQYVVLPSDKNNEGITQSVKRESKVGQTSKNPDVEARKLVRAARERIEHNIQYVAKPYIIRSVTPMAHLCGDYIIDNLGSNKSNVDIEYDIPCSEEFEDMLYRNRSKCEDKLIKPSNCIDMRVTNYEAGPIENYYNTGQYGRLRIWCTVKFKNNAEAIAFQQEMAFLCGMNKEYFNITRNRHVGR